MKNRFKLVFLMVLLVSFTLTSCTKKPTKVSKDDGTASSLTKAPISSLTKAPNFELKNTTGDIIKLSDYKGKIVLLDFWGTWCPPCRKMIPVLSSFVDKCSDKGVVLLGIHSAGNSPGAAKIDELAGEMGVNYPMLIGTKENQDAYRVKNFPTLFLIGRDGMIKRKIVGMHSLDKIREYVKEEMDKK